tara:strand:+ start:783 stop:1040 length:258 start_codon:yes stop_codon:yes gene_type:complete
MARSNLAFGPKYPDLLKRGLNFPGAQVSALKSKEKTEDENILKYGPGLSVVLRKIIKMIIGNTWLIILSVRHRAKRLSRLFFQPT